MKRKNYKRLFWLGIVLIVCNALLVTDALADDSSDNFKIISRCSLFILAIGFTLIISMKMRRLPDE